MTEQDYRNGHSADVRMRLLLNGFSLRIGQLGPDFLILREFREHPACEAEISLTVDGQEERWPVYLPEGPRPSDQRTPIAKI